MVPATKGTAMTDAATILLRTRALLPIIEHRRGGADPVGLSADNLADLVRGQVTGMVVPTDLGGPGLSIAQCLPVISALAEVCPVTAQVAVDTNLGLPTAVLHHGSRDLRASWASALRAGRRPADCGILPGEDFAFPPTPTDTEAPSFVAQEVRGGRRAYATCGTEAGDWIALSGEADAVKAATDMRRLGAAAIALGVAARAVGGLRDRTGGSASLDLRTALAKMEAEIAEASGRLTAAAQGSGVARAKMLTIATANRIVAVAGQVFDHIGHSGAASLDHLASDLRAIDGPAPTAHVPARSGASAA